MTLWCLVHRSFFITYVKVAFVLCVLLVHFVLLAAMYKFSYLLTLI